MPFRLPYHLFLNCKTALAIAALVFTLSAQAQPADVVEATAEPTITDATEVRIGSTVVETPGIDIQLTADPAAATPAATDTESSAFDQEQLYRFVAQGMDLWRVPGMSVTVVNKDEVLFQQGFGQTATRDGLAVDEHTLFAAASTTKAMVVAGILMLQDEGKLSLSDPITQHLPEVQFGDPILNRDVTVADLLAHRTGLPSTDLWTFMQAMSLDEQISRLREVKPEASLRARLIYQNTMYELAGLLIERLSGERWDVFLMHRLWHAIGMRETYGSREQIPTIASHVWPYHFVGDELVLADWDFAANLADAAGSVWTSAHDMGLWAQFLLRNGVTAAGERLISEAGMAQMFEPMQLATVSDFYPTAELTQPHWRSYGLGWFQQDFQGRMINYHTGSLSGLIALIGLDRDNDKAVVILGNRDHAEMRHAVLWNVMDQSQPVERDWNQEIYALYQREREKSEERWNETRQQRIANANTGLPLTAFAGRYNSKVNGDVVVVYSDRRLLFKTALDTFELRHWHLNAFVAEFPPDNRVFAEFEIGFDGKVKALDILGDTFTRIADGPDLD
ncbi:MAG: serine hydrolase [Xanthomonadales bacterium]|nr:serine hydrolase [Xanthomonadales bacterium]